ncbi:MAG: hypothetical protein ACK4FV_07220 [Candidatus Nitrosocaldus sp.]
MIFFRKKNKEEGIGKEKEEEGGDTNSQHHIHQSYLEVNLEGLRAMIDRLNMEKGSNNINSKDAGIPTSIKEAIQIARRFNQHIYSLKSVSEGLQKRKVSADVTPPLKGMIDRARSTIASVIDEVSRPIPEPKDINDIVLIKERTRRILDRVGDLVGSHRKILYEFLPSEAKALKDVLMAMKNDVDTLESIAKGIDEQISSYSRCKDRIARLVQMEQEIKAYGKKIMEMKGTLDALERKRVEIEKSRVSISSEGKYMELENNLSKVKIEYDRLLADIARDFSRLGRVVSKYAYEIGFDRESYAILNAVMYEPSRLKDTRVEVMGDILLRLSDSITSGRLRLKNPEKDIDNIHGLMERLGYYIDKCKEYEEMVSLYRERITPYKDMLKGIDADIEHIEREIYNVKDIIKEYDSKISMMRSTMDVEIERLRDDIYKIYGLKVNINVNIDGS